MKPSLNRILLCVVPATLGLLICGIGFWNYTNDPLKLIGTPILPKLKPKMGVDLVGGTILVYEVDLEKFTGGRLPEGYKKEQLVASLKKRLDPADLKSITIRPVSDTRVEIILPTGGRHRSQQEEARWQELLDKVKQEWPALAEKNATLKVRRGDVQELSRQIAQLTEKPTEDIDTFLKNNFTASTEEALTGEDVEELKELIQRVGSLEFRILANRHDDKEALEAAQKYFQAAADNWKEFLTTVKGKYADADKATEKDPRTLNDIACGDFNELQKLTVARNPKVDAKEIVQFLKANFKPNKQLDDLIKRAEAGLPPPSPEGPDRNQFKVTLEEGEHRFTYSWVEIGKNELHSLGLNNQAVEDAVQKLVKKNSKQGMTEEDARNSPEVKEIEAVKAAIEKIRNQGVAADSSEVLFGRIGTPEWATLLYTRKIPNPDARLAAKDRDKKFEYYILTRDPEPGKAVTGEYLVNAREDTDQSGGLAVGFRFNSRGATLFGELTTANRPPREGEGRRFLAIVLDGQVMSAPRLNAVIRDSGIISGRFTKTETEQLTTILNSGALPATLKPQPVSENTMGATLGDDTIRAGLFSIGAAFLAVLLFMVYYYRWAGLFACVALLANLILTVAFMLAVSATFTLPGLAGLVLTLAMAVDANVLIYERIREERDRGASLQLAIRQGYERAFPTVIDTHLSSIFTAIVLYVVGNDQLKGFGISLTVGLIISLYTALYITRTLFNFGLAKGWLKHLSMVRLFTRANINFMGIRKKIFALTVFLSVMGIVLFLYRGSQGLNMDFVGGTVYGGELTEYYSVSELRKQLSEERQRELLALEKNPEPVENRSNTWKVVYKTGEERVISLPEQITPEQLRARLEVLPEPTLELTFHSSPELTRGAESKLFTLRTPEKSSELVSASINRLLGEKLKKTEMQSFALSQATLVFKNDSPVTLDQARALVDTAVKDSKLLKAGNAVEVTGGEQPKVNEFRTVLVTFKEEVPGTDLIKALTTIKDKRLENVELVQTHLKLTDYAYLSQVRSLLQGQLTAQGQQVSVDPVGEERDGRYREMNVRLSARVDAATLQNAITTFATELEARPLPVRLENFDSQLASDTQRRALYAIVASWGAMLLYLWFRFGNWTFGLAAVFCLIHDLFFTMGIIAACHYVHGTWIGDWLAVGDFKIDLPAIASLLTLIGFSVNDTIVVFDRIREVRGKNPNLTSEMINSSINQTLSRTILTSFIAWMVVLVLYIWGGEGVHLFAFVMVVGVVIGTYSSIYVASPLLLLLGEGAPLPGTQPEQREERVSRSSER